MSLPIPGTEFRLRVVEKVVTDDLQYDVYDIGLEHPCGGIDSVAVGGSFHTLKNAIQAVNRAGFERREKKSGKSSD